MKMNERQYDRNEMQFTALIEGTLSASAGLLRHFVDCLPADKRTELETLFADHHPAVTVQWTRDGIVLEISCEHDGGATRRVLQRATLPNGALGTVGPMQ